MAERITSPPPKPDPREALFKKLQDAPQDHAEALLDAYALLQLMRDKGLFEIAKDTLGSGEKLLWILTQTMESDEVLALFRNLATLVKIIGGLNPAVLDDVERTLVKSVNSAKAKKPPSLFKILGRLSNPESRRFLGSVADVVESVGKNYAQADISGRKRKKTYRHNA